MIDKIVTWVKFYFPSYKSNIYSDNFVKCCLVYNYINLKYFKRTRPFADVVKILYNDYALISSATSNNLSNHLIFKMAFKRFWELHELGRGKVHLFNSPFKDSDKISDLTGIIYWFFHRGVIE